MRYFIFICLLLLSTVAATNNNPPWLQLPATPSLPKSVKSGYVSIHKAKLWYAIFGHGEPVILLHGALTNSNYWGNQVPALAKHYQVIVIDSRGQGRSSNDNQPYSYNLMASDVIDVMNFLHIKKAAIVGWSDGAIIGLTLAIHHPERLTKLFAFGANSKPEGIKEGVMENSVIKECLARSAKEYEELSPTPNNFNDLLNQLEKMMQSQPNFTSKELQSITTRTWIVDGDHEEAIKRSDTEYLANEIPQASLLLLPETSHFAMLQDPILFNKALLHFLK